MGPSQDAQCITLCGPDATKIGSDFNVSLTVCSDGASGFSAFGPPQVLVWGKRSSVFYKRS